MRTYSPAPLLIVGLSLSLLASLAAAFGYHAECAILFSSAYICIALSWTISTAHKDKE